MSLCKIDPALFPCNAFNSSELCKIDPTLFPCNAFSSSQFLKLKDQQSNLLPKPHCIRSNDTFDF
uniref:Uncharacterized protein n=1 Tax=Zea mays TaxID=4577 RepID=B6TUD0_MAIZE|nr:hypothetical protein [Zea mays]